jgi:acyl-CoA hydrolase
MAKKKAAKKKAAKAKASKRKVVKKVKAEKPIGKVTHFFDKISVAAVKLLAPLKVGDIIRIKGHITDFVQKVESMQIEHANVLKAKKGDEIGIKVIDKIRDHDYVYAAKEKDLMKPAAVPAAKPPAQLPQAKKPENYSGKKFLSF